MMALSVMVCSGEGEGDWLTSHHAGLEGVDAIGNDRSWGCGLVDREDLAVTPILMTDGGGQRTAAATYQQR